MQAFVRDGFAGLSPLDFGYTGRFVTFQDTRAPPGFETTWHSLCEPADLPSVPWYRGEELRKLHFALLMANIADIFQLRLLTHFVMRLDFEDPQAPTVLLLLIDEAIIQYGETDTEEEEGNLEVLQPLMELGVDDCIVGEPKGWDLVFEVQAAISRLVHTNERIAIQTQNRPEVVQHTKLKAALHETIWNYLRYRVARSIPPMRPDLNEEAGAIAGYRLATRLGGGSFGEIYEVTPLRSDADRDPHVAKAMKVLDKGKVKGLIDLQWMNRAIQTWTTMSSQQWSHPNVALLYAVYHGPHKIFLLMEHAGNENLYTRLSRRDAKPLNTTMIKAIAKQASAAVAHLHTGPSICHRDIKPENMVLNEHLGEVRLKLIDFDFAMPLAPGRSCSTFCGTFPFAAPEMSFRKEYDGFAADVWSLALVITEVFCVSRAAERAMKDVLKVLAPPLVRDTGEAGEAERQKRVMLSAEEWTAIVEELGGLRFLQNLLMESGVEEGRPLWEAYMPALSVSMSAEPSVRLTAQQLEQIVSEEGLV